MLDLETLVGRSIVLDAATGLPASFTEARREHEAVWRETHGALSHELVEELAARAPDDAVEAEVWVRQEPFTPLLEDDLQSAEDMDAVQREFTLQLRERFRPRIAQLEETLRRRRDVEILRIEEIPPTVTITTTRSVLEREIAFLPGVSTVHAVEPSKLLAVDAAQDLVEGPLFFAHAVLGSGRGLRIYVEEQDACIEDSNPVFQEVTFEDSETSVELPDGRRLVCRGEDEFGSSNHTTRVAGTLAGIHGPFFTLLVGLFQGILYEGPDFSDQAVLGHEPAPPHLINISETTGCAQRRRLDWFVYVHRIFLANASSQEPVSSETTCCAYNSLCVGSYRHQGTLGPGNFTDDTPGDHNFANFDNREEPDVVGAWRVSVPVVGPETGTSYSTPAVTGLAALLIANHPSDLLGDPTLLRAVLMASANHNILSADERPRCTVEPCVDAAHVPIFGDSIDDHDGAGAPRGDRATEILSSENFFSGYLDRDADFDADGFLPPLHFSAEPGDTVRVALVWDQCADVNASVPDTLLVDLDMVVTGPPVGDPEQIKANQSSVDNYEMVHFVVTEGGRHTIAIRADRWEPCPIEEPARRAHVAVAWDVQPSTSP